MYNEIEAVIFDLDGTIADSLYVWAKVDEDFFGKRGREIPDNYAKHISAMSFREAAAYTKEQYGFSEEIEEIMDEWYGMAIEEYSCNVKLKTHVREYIEYLKGNNIKIALCTASPKDLYEPLLKNNGVYEYFDAFVSGTEVPVGKEFPDIYIMTAERLGVRSERCIVFEDIVKGIIGSKKAGMTAIGVYDFTSETEKEKIVELADGYIYDFQEMYK